MKLAIPVVETAASAAAPHVHTAAAEWAPEAGAGAAPRSAALTRGHPDGRVTRRVALLGALTACLDVRALSSADADALQQLGRVWTVPQQTHVVIPLGASSLELPILVDAMADWLIPLSSSVTVQVPNGRLEISRHVAYRGRDGARFRIIGNPAAPESCVLGWAQSGDLFFAPAGTVLGLLDGFTVEHWASGTRGNGSAFLAEGSGTLSVGRAVRVRDFYYGFQARLGGVIRCAATQCMGAGDAAFFAFNGGHIDAPGAVAVGARDVDRKLGSGFVAEYGGTINAEGATARYNDLAGFHALSNGVIRAYRAIAQRNGRAGFLAQSGGTIVAHGATATENCGPGIAVEGAHATFEAETRNEMANHRDAATCSVEQ